MPRGRHTRHRLNKLFPGFWQELKSIHQPRESQSLGVLEDFAKCLSVLTELTGVQHSVDYIQFLYSKRDAEVVDYEVSYDKTVQACIGIGLRRKRVDQHRAYLIS